MLLLTIYNWYSFVNFEGNGSLKKKPQSYLYNFIIIILGFWSFQKLSTRINLQKKKPQTNKTTCESESWVVVVVKFGQDFDQFSIQRTYVYTGHSVELKMVEMYVNHIFIFHKNIRERVRLKREKKFLSFSSIIYTCSKLSFSSLSTLYRKNSHLTI